MFLFFLFINVGKVAMLCTGGFGTILLSFFIVFIVAAESRGWGGLVFMGNHSRVALFRSYSDGLRM